MADKADQGFGDPLGKVYRYERVADINNGAYGFVQKCKDKKTGEMVACKFVLRKAADSNESYLKYLEREIVNHCSLHHRFIIEFKDFFLLPKYQVIVMELADAGDLFDYVISREGLNESQARPLFQQFIIGLDYCHKNGIVNRDVKPENTLLQTSEDGLIVKICDFGNSKDQVRGSQARTKVGSPQYMAPEVIESPHEYDGKAADMWSCGVMLFVMLMARYPFLGPNEKMNHSKVFQRMIEADYTLKEGLSEDVVDLIRGLLTVDTTQRLSLDQVKQHPWFTTDIPQQLMTMNDTVSAPPTDLPSPQEVSRIIREGIVNPPLDPNPPPPVATSAEDVTPQIENRRCCVIC